MKIALLLLGQRYNFESKSQLKSADMKPDKAVAIRTKIQF